MISLEGNILDEFDLLVWYPNLIDYVMCVGV